MHYRVKSHSNWFTSYSVCIIKIWTTNYLYFILIFNGRMFVSRAITVFNKFHSYVWWHAIWNVKIHAFKWSEIYTLENIGWAFFMWIVKNKSCWKLNFFTIHICLHVRYMQLKFLFGYSDSKRSKCKIFKINIIEHHQQNTMCYNLSGSVLQLQLFLQL